MKPDSVFLLSCLVQSDPAVQELNHVKTGDIITKQGHTFEWTEHHLSPEQLEPMRQIGDDAADTVAVGLRGLSSASRQCLDLLYACHAAVAASAPAPPSDAKQPEEYLSVGCFRAQPKFLKKGYTQLRRVIAAAWLLQLDDGPQQLPPHVKAGKSAHTYTLSIDHSGKLLQATVHESVAAACRQLLVSASADPQWLDRRKLAEGQAFYREHTLGCNLSLLHLSLIGGFGAPLINRVLASTGYLVGRQGSAEGTPPSSANGKVIATRLFETSAMVHTCMLPGALEPGACGWEHSVAVRLLHAAVRCRLDPPRLPTPPPTSHSEHVPAHSTTSSCPFSGLPSAAPAGASWDRAAWGVPINQEDLVVTSMAFSYIVLAAMELMQLWQPRDVLPQWANVPVRAFSAAEEQEYAVFRKQLPPAAFARHTEATLRGKFIQYTSFLHLWRYIAFLMGVHDSALPVDSLVGAKAVTESLVCHLVHPDATSGLLADSIITGMSDVHPAYIPRPFLAALTWRLQGPLLAATMRVPWVPGVRRALLEGNSAQSMSDCTVSMEIFDTSIFGWLLWAATELRLSLVRALTLTSQLPLVGPWMRRAQMATILGFLEHSLNDSRTHDYSLAVDANVERQQSLLGQAAVARELPHGPQGVLPTLHLCLYYCAMFMPIQLRYYFGSHSWRCAMMAVAAAVLTSVVWYLLTLALA